MDVFRLGRYRLETSFFSRYKFEANSTQNSGERQIHMSVRRSAQTALNGVVERREEGGSRSVPRRTIPSFRFHTHRCAVPRPLRCEPYRNPDRDCRALATPSHPHSHYYIAKVPKIIFTSNLQCRIEHAMDNHKANVYCSEMSHRSISNIRFHSFSFFVGSSTRLTSALSDFPPPPLPLPSPQISLILYSTISTMPR